MVFSADYKLTFCIDFKVASSLLRNSVSSAERDPYRLNMWHDWHDWQFMA
jgi:hypothetical protein